MTRIRALTRANSDLATVLSKEMRRRRRAERTLGHESNALHEAFRENDALKSENAALLESMQKMAKAGDECAAHTAKLIGDGDERIARLRQRIANALETIDADRVVLDERHSQIVAIRLAASQFPARYRKQIQDILEAK